MKKKYLYIIIAFLIINEVIDRLDSRGGAGILLIVMSLEKTLNLMTQRLIAIFGRHGMEILIRLS